MVTLQDSPIRSLMEAGFDAHKRQDVRLYYGARNLGRMAYQVHAESFIQDICNEYSWSYGANKKKFVNNSPFFSLFEEYICLHKKDKIDGFVS